MKPSSASLILRAWLPVVPLFDIHPAYPNIPMDFLFVKPFF